MHAVTRSIMNPRTQHDLDAFDALLARHRPFADSDYLHEQLCVRYKRRLGAISERLSVAADLSRALERATPHCQYRVVGDPVVRHAIQQALRQVVKGTHDGVPLEACEEILRETVRHLSESRSGGPLESRATDVGRLGTEPWHAWIWSESQSDDVLGHVFRSVLHDNFPSERVCAPRLADLALLAKGAALLGALLPLCARSALSHAHVVVLFDGQKASCSDFRVGGTIFLNREMLHDPWWVAEHLLHESLHQKLYDFRHTHSLLARDLSRELSASPETLTIRSIWNVGRADRSNHWDTFRAVAAFHVYVHLALLWLQAERRTADLVMRFSVSEGSFMVVTQRRTAFERAHYLGRRIKESAWQELGIAGQLLVDWLLSILDEIDPSPPPPESFYIHLVLERYVTEASMAASAKASPELGTPLLTLIDDEAEALRRVLSAIHAERADLDRLEGALARRSDESPGAAFLRFRTEVAGIVRSLSPNGYELKRPSPTESTPANEVLQAMFERSTERLGPLLEGRQ